MPDYIYQNASWPNFTWDTDALTDLLSNVHHNQERLLSQMSALGFQLREEATLQSLTEEVLKSSLIEGEHLDKEQVRSSIARRLGLEVAGVAHADRHVEGVVEMMLDATQNFAKPLTDERLFSWHAALFPTGRSGMTRIVVGQWRGAASGPMQVVSGPLGHETVHYEAPEAPVLAAEMAKFLSWYERYDGTDLILRAAVAHLWFVTIHPFEDGNGRIARALSDMALARSEKSAQRFYSMSAQIEAEKNAYYDILEVTQKGALDITAWLVWFLGCLDRAFANAGSILGAVLEKARFWDAQKGKPFNERQILMLNKLLNGFEGKLTSSKWAKIAKCSQDTAVRDIEDLIEKGVLRKDEAGGRSTSYSLVT